MFAAASVFGGVAHAGIVWNSANMVNVDNAGNYTGAVWSTTGCCAGLTVTQGAAYGGSSAVSLPLTLVDGTMHLFFAGYTFPVNLLAVDMFFDESTAGAAAQITVFNNGVTTSGSGNQPGYAFVGSNPNGGLSYTIGGRTVTASNFSVFDSVNNIAQLDLTVGPTQSGAAPEPGSIGLMLVGVSLIALKRSL